MAEHLMKEAQAAQLEGDLEATIILLERIVAEYPDSEQAAEANDKLPVMLFQLAKSTSDLQHAVFTLMHIMDDFPESSQARAANREIDLFARTAIEAAGEKPGPENREAYIGRINELKAVFAGTVAEQLFADALEGISPMRGLTREERMRVSFKCRLCQRRDCDIEEVNMGQPGVYRDANGATLMLISCLHCGHVLTFNSRLIHDDEVFSHMLRAMWRR